MRRAIHSIQTVAHHRNGIAGVGFYVVAFTAREERRKLVAIVFPDAAMHTAVLDPALAAQGNIAFGEGNSWRGDEFDLELRAAIEAWEQTRAPQPPANPRELTCKDHNRHLWLAATPAECPLPPARGSGSQ